MLKLLLCLICAVVIAVTLLQMRQQHLELNFQVNRLHNQIKSRQSKLWDQQLQIAVYTAPNAITKTVNEQELRMVPETPLTTLRANWYDAPDDSDRE